MEVLENFRNIYILYILPSLASDKSISNYFISKLVQLRNPSAPKFPNSFLLTLKMFNKLPQIFRIFKLLGITQTWNLSWTVLSKFTSCHDIVFVCISVLGEMEENGENTVLLLCSAEAFGVQLKASLSLWAYIQFLMLCLPSLGRFSVLQ